MDGRGYYPFWPNRSAAPAVSWSAESAYASCPRRWFYQYQNRLLPMAEGRLIRAEKELVPSEALVGKVVHDVIETAFRRFQTSGVPPDAQWEVNGALGVRAACRERFQQYFAFSRAWAQAFAAGTNLPHATDGSLAPMAAVFHREGPSAEEAKRLISTAEGCVLNLLRSPLYERIVAAGPSCVVLQRRGTLPDGGGRCAIPWYWAGQSPVYASYDLILLPEQAKTDGTAAAASRAVIVDWKTGRRGVSEQQVERQLNYYAPFVVAEYGIPYEHIELVAAWIGEGTETSVFGAIPDFAERQETRWALWQGELRGHTAAVESDPTLLDIAFPMSDDVHRCRWCPFRSCPGYGRHHSLLAAGSDEAPMQAEDGDGMW